MIGQAGILSALLATVISSLTIALLSGAGTEDLIVTTGIGLAQKQEWTHRSFPDLWELVKAAVWLWPITAVSCGSFGLLAGSAGGALMYARAKRIRSLKRFLLESVVLGIVLALGFPYCDFAMDSAQGIRIEFYPQFDFLAPVLGGASALICAAALRKRFISRNQPA